MKIKRVESTGERERRSGRREKRESGGGEIEEKPIREKDGKGRGKSTVGKGIEGEQKMCMKIRG